MKDKGLDRGLVQSFDTSARIGKGHYYGFRKMFWDYLNKLEVPFYDICCTDASDNPSPVRFNVTSGSFERFDATTKTWIEANGSGGAAATGITAFATGGQTSATQLTPGFNEVTTVATAGDSVKLPTAAPSTVVIVKNEGVASLDVFPFLADTINDGAANVAYAVPAGATVVFTAVDTVNWETDSQIAVASGVVNSTGTMLGAFFPTTAAQALSGAGAVNVTAFLTKFTSTGAGQALTLASGTQVGQRKKVSHVVDGGSGIMTAVYVGGTTITFTTVGEFADLIWSGSSWAVLELGNTATPGTPPVLA